MVLPQLTESSIRSHVSAQSLQRGKAYYRDGAISDPALQGSTLLGRCEGSQEPYYQVRIDLNEAGIAAADCTCAYDFGGDCNHILALLPTYLHQPEQVTVRPEVSERPTRGNRDPLVA